MKVDGLVKKGHQIASGFSQGSPYPAGSISMQAPFFKALGLDLQNYYLGTINVCIKPHAFKILSADYHFKAVQWTDSIDAEDFSFVKCLLTFDNKSYKSLMYYPHPETKPDHFHDASTIEILSTHIDGLTYGSAVSIAFSEKQIEVK